MSKFSFFLVSFLYASNVSVAWTPIFDNEIKAFSFKSSYELGEIEIEGYIFNYSAFGHFVFSSNAVNGRTGIFGINVYKKIYKFYDYATDIYLASYIGVGGQYHDSLAFAFSGGIGPKIDFNVFELPFFVAIYLNWGNLNLSEPSFSEPSFVAVTKVCQTVKESALVYGESAVEKVYKILPNGVVVEFGVNFKI